MSEAPFTPDRWRRIEELFHASIELPEEQRAKFLQDACGNDERMRCELESLLAADDEESPLIASIVDNATATLLLKDDSEP